jgi:hypothetical protein
MALKGGSESYQLEKTTLCHLSIISFEIAIKICYFCVEMNARVRFEKEQPVRLKPTVTQSVSRGPCTNIGLRPLVKFAIYAVPKCVSKMLILVHAKKKRCPQATN